MHLGGGCTGATVRRYFCAPRSCAARRLLVFAEDWDECRYVGSFCCRPGAAPGYPKVDAASTLRNFAHPTAPSRQTKHVWPHRNLASRSFCRNVGCSLAYFCGSRQHRSRRCLRLCRDELHFLIRRYRCAAVFAPQTVCCERAHQSSLCGKVGTRAEVIHQ